MQTDGKSTFLVLPCAQEKEIEYPLSAVRDFIASHRTLLCARIVSTDRRNRRI